MTEQISSSWGEAGRRFEDSRWEVTITDISNGTIKVDILRSLTTFNCGAIYVGKPNYLERIFKVTFTSKLQRAIRKQQERCNQLNRAIVLSQRLKIEAGSVLKGELKRNE